MKRGRLLELALTITNASDEERIIFWELREQLEYPARPGHDPMWRVLASHIVVVRGMPSQAALTSRPGTNAPPGILAMARAVFLDHRAEPMLVLIDDALRAGEWARVTINGDNSSWLSSPWLWETVLESKRRGFAIVRRMEPARVRMLPRTPLRFPLTCYVLATSPSADAARRELVEQLGMEVDCGVLAFPEDPDQVDILHICDELNGEIAERLIKLNPRLVIFTMADLEAGLTADPQRNVFERSVTSFAEATCSLSWGAAANAYRRILRGDPLDRVMVNLREAHEPEHAVLLRCIPDGELCVSLSRVIDLAMRIDGVGTSEGLAIEVDGAADADSMMTEWRDAIIQPFNELSVAADRITEEDLHDRGVEGLREAVEVARAGRALVTERAEAVRCLHALAALDAPDLARVSARTTQISIHDPGGDAPSLPCHSLIVGRDYLLRIRVTRIVSDASWASVVFPEHLLRETLSKVESTVLTVVLYASEGPLHLEVKRSTLMLPRIGDSDPLDVAMTVRNAGCFAVRVCVFHHATLLHAVLVQGTAVPSDHPLELPAVVSQLDFAASSHLMRLDDQARPDVTIWTNEALNGTHWIGVFTGDAPDACGLRCGLEELSSHDLTNVAQGLQDALRDAQLEDASQPDASRYRFDEALASTDDLYAFIKLARAGWQAYTALFNRTSLCSPAAVPGGAVLAIARCRPERTNIPWAALYDYPLNGSTLTMCPVFAAALGKPADQLGDSATCRARSDCPLSDAKRARRTVCPFGFWGARHHIEQPLCHIKQGPASYSALQAAAGLAPTIPILDRERAPSIAIAEGPGFGEHVAQHLLAVTKLGLSRRESTRSRVLELLAQTDQQIYYFFCHGIVDRLSLRLRMSADELDAELDDEEAGDISVSDLNDERFTWLQPRAAPLVFLNGCDTIAFKSETINTFIDRLRAMGASGVIGTEIPVHSNLAEDVGMRILAALLEGRTLGDAFLAMRRALLCEQGNPLGLAYTFFASARLHLCGARCALCNQHDGSLGP